jgi:Tol biopolymer transport system component
MIGKVENMKYGIGLIALALGVAPLSAPTALAQRVPAPPGQKNVMLFDRFGPATSVMYVANADGSNKHPLFATSGFDYDGSFSADGKWIVFTSEREGEGQADIYRVHPDGSGLERLTNDPAMDDQAALSPDGSKLVFVSTRNAPLHTANVWVLDLKTKTYKNLTGGKDLQSPTPGKPDAFLRPSWSPDGKWIAFSSDRNTDWVGAEKGAGAGHSQEASIYLIRPDGTGFRRLTPPGISAGSPKWSADGKKIVCYEIDPKLSFLARVANFGTATSQIVTIDVATGAVHPETTGPGLKVSPQFLPDGSIGYTAKGRTAGAVVNPSATSAAAPPGGIAYTGGAKTVQDLVRNASWSPDGKLVVYQTPGFLKRPQNQRLYSWDPNYEYRYTDSFPATSPDGKKLSVTDLANIISNPTTTISVMDTDGSNPKMVFSDPAGAAMGQQWSPDGKKLVFGWGAFFPARDFKPARIIVVNADGSGSPVNLTGKTAEEPNSGFPSWSPDGKQVVYRVWTKTVEGLNTINVQDGTVKSLTTGWDNFPHFSPDGSRILFTRQVGTDFDVYTMKPDGTDLKQLTNAPGSDGHASYTADGKQIFFSSSRSGMKDEGPLYDNSPQPYAQVWVMNADGSNQHQVTDSKWEDAMGIYVTQPRTVTTAE